MDSDYEDIDPTESFRQAWHEAMTGQTRPVEEFLRELDEEDNAMIDYTQIKPMGFSATGKMVIFDPEQRLKEIAAAIQENTRQIGESILDTGAKLLEAKSLVEHGRWRTFVDEQCGMSLRIAEYHIAAYLRFGYEPETVANFQRSAIYLLTGADEPTLQRAREIARHREVSKADVHTLTSEIPDAIKDRMTTGDLSRKQAKALAAAVGKSTSERVAELAAKRLTNADVVPILETMDDEELDEIEATGYLAGNEVIPLEDLTSRDITRYIDDTKREKTKLRIAEDRETLVFFQRSEIKRFRPGYLIAEIENLPELKRGEEVYITIERKVKKRG